MFKINNNDIRTTPGVFIVNFGHISHLVLVFLLLTFSNKCRPVFSKTWLKEAVITLVVFGFFNSYDVDSSFLFQLGLVWVWSSPARTNLTYNLLFFNAEELKLLASLKSYRCRLHTCSLLSKIWWKISLENGLFCYKWKQQ